MKVTTNLPTTFVVVVLGSMWVGRQFVDEDAVLEVERAVRNDWIGSKLARDATDEEIAAFRAEQGDELDDLDEQRAALEAEIAQLQERKTELGGDLKALESDLEEFGKQRDTLTDEIKALEAAKVEAAKPATAKVAK
jgi:chromosome segregation ATPase